MNFAPKSITRATPMSLDRTDQLLLRALQQDGRATYTELSERAHLSESSCLRRVRRMEAAGAIARYAAIVNPEVIGLPLSVFITVTLESQSEEAFAAFESEVANVPEVMECHLMAGSADYLLRVVARDVQDLAEIHSTRLTRLARVGRMTSSIAMREVVRRDNLPIVANH
ncbi:MAG: AsnC family transcriptional regulator [Bradyrhizobium sp.]|nr:AsnC family transcriptional regulator [Bradyrhizobium sp.]